MKVLKSAMLAAICALAVVCSFGPVVAQNTDSAPSLSAPATAVVVGEDYKIAEEDILKIDVWGEPQLTNLQTQVTPDGNINIAFIGEIHVEGLTRTDLAKKIAEALDAAQIIADARVQVTVLTLHQPTVRVHGQVQRPGAVVFKDGDTVLDALAYAGGQTENSYLEKSVLIQKATGEQKPIDLKKLLHGDLTQNYVLGKGDILYVPPEDYYNKIYVLGQVMRPGIFALKDRTTVLAAISMAGGGTPRASLRHSWVVRGDLKNPQKVPCDVGRLFDKADLSQDIVLMPGDAVIVPETKGLDWNKAAQIISSLINLSYLRRNGF